MEGSTSNQLSRPHSDTHEKTNEMDDMEARMLGIALNSSKPFDDVVVDIDGKRYKINSMSYELDRIVLHGELYG
jgi:hypothetical protein|tara:strand:- start:2696 stop:2917 length:222 start_codon:yes stop_codon:yes gene_type:complete